VRKYHKPDFFITYTCNPKWPEIQESLLEGQKPEDRPDLLARIFNEKFKRYDYYLELNYDLACDMHNVVNFLKNNFFTKIIKN